MIRVFLLLKKEAWASTTQSQGAAIKNFLILV